MDIIECFVIGPVIFDIVNQKLAVGRDEGGLDRGEVNAGDLCCGMLFSEFDRPETGAGANVQNFITSRRRRGYRRDVEIAVEGQPPLVVLEI